MHSSSGHWSPRVSLTCCTNRKAPSDWHSHLHSASRGFLWPGGKHGRWPSPQPNPEPNEGERDPEWKWNTERKRRMQFKKCVYTSIIKATQETWWPYKEITAPFQDEKELEKRLIFMTLSLPSKFSTHPSSLPTQILPPLTSSPLHWVATLGMAHGETAVAGQHGHLWCYVEEKG